METETKTETKEQTKLELENASLRADLSTQARKHDKADMSGCLISSALVVLGMGLLAGAAALIAWAIAWGASQ